MIKVEIIKKSVEKEGLFDFDELHKFCKKWMKDNNYFVKEEKNYKNQEEKKIKIIEWSCEKKVTDYVKFEIDVKFRAPKIEKAEVKKNKKKVEIDKGKIGVEMGGNFIKDYEKEWRDNPLIKFGREIYDKTVILGRLNKYRSMLKQEVEDFASKVRGQLNLEKL